MARGKAHNWQQIATFRGFTNPRAMFMRWYVEDRRSKREIAQLTGTSYGAVSDALWVYEIPRRYSNESIRLWRLTDDELFNSPICLLAKKYGAHRNTVRNERLRRRTKALREAAAAEQAALDEPEPQEDA